VSKKTAVSVKPSRRGGSEGTDRAIVHGLVNAAFPVENLDADLKVI